MTTSNVPAGWSSVGTDHDQSDHRMLAVQAQIDDVFDNPATSNWLKSAITTLMQRDPLDAASDAAALADLFNARVNAVLGR